jgi:hypothetical protein
MARPRGVEPLSYRFVARSEEGFEDNSARPSTAASATSSCARQCPIQCGRVRKSSSWNACCPSTRPRAGVPRSPAKRLAEAPRCEYVLRLSLDDRVASVCPARLHQQVLPAGHWLEGGNQETLRVGDRDAIRARERDVREIRRHGPRQVTPVLCLVAPGLVASLAAAGRPADCGMEVAHRSAPRAHTASGVGATEVRTRAGRGR